MPKARPHRRPPAAPSRRHRLFASRGYAATSIREIVEAAGVTKPVLYYHFQSKEGLYRAILGDVQLRLEELLASERSSHRPGARPGGAALPPGLGPLRAGEGRGPVHQRRLLGAAPGRPAHRLHTCFSRRSTSALERLVQDGIASGELRRADPADAARALLAVLAHSMDLALAYPRLSGGKAGLVRCLDLVFRGLAAPAQPRPETTP